MEDYSWREAEREAESKLRFILFLALVGDAVILGCLYLCAYVDCAALLTDCSRGRRPRQPSKSFSEPEDEPAPAQFLPL